MVESRSNLRHKNYVEEMASSNIGEIMGMFSMGEGREIREVDELRQIRRQPQVQYPPTAEEKFDKLIRRADTPDFKRTTHYGMEVVAAAGVEYLSEGEAQVLEELMNKAVRGLNSGSQDRNNKVFRAAKRETIVQIKKGKI